MIGVIFLCAEVKVWRHVGYGPEEKREDGRTKALRCSGRSDSAQPKTGLDSRTLNVTSDMYNNVTMHLLARVKGYCRHSARLRAGM